jgi:glucosamine-6-phosphate deaminase
VITQTFDTPAALAGALAERVRLAIEARPALVLGLPTGHTPLPFYAALRNQAREGRIDWSAVRTFNLDEFVGLNGAAPGSYRHYMDRELFGAVAIPAEHIGFLDGCAPDLDAECARYERAIATAGGIDVMILGIGANGHIGFNEPAPELEPRTHQVRLLEATRAANRAWFDDRLERVPVEAMSMGMATILQSRHVVLVATGDTKRAAVERMLNGPITTALPASFLQLHPNATVMLDPAATPR